jgi:hypothetical protein
LPVIRNSAPPARAVTRYLVIRIVKPEGAVCGLDDHRHLLQQIGDREQGAMIVFVLRPGADRTILLDDGLREHRLMMPNDVREHRSTHAVGARCRDQDVAVQDYSHLRWR